MSIAIRFYQPGDEAEWLRLRLELWGDGQGAESLREEMDAIIAETNQDAIFALAADGHFCGFAEVAIRRWADGCDGKDVGYLEGWYVEEAFRRRGIGRQLVQAGEQWSRDQGASQMGSDCEIDNETSYRAHLALGFTEANRTINFGKKL